MTSNRNRFFRSLLIGTAAVLCLALAACGGEMVDDEYDTYDEEEIGSVEQASGDINQVGLTATNRCDFFTRIAAYGYGPGQIAYCCKEKLSINFYNGQSYWYKDGRCRSAWYFPCWTWGLDDGYPNN